MSGLGVERRVLPVGVFTTGEDFRDYFKAHYGPTIAVYSHLGASAPERIADLDRDLADLARRFDLGGGALEWEYLLVTGRRG